VINRLAGLHTPQILNHKTPLLGEHLKKENQKSYNMVILSPDKIGEKLSAIIHSNSVSGHKKPSAKIHSSQSGLAKNV